MGWELQLASPLRRVSQSAWWEKALMAPWQKERIETLQAAQAALRRVAWGNIVRGVFGRCIGQRVCFLLFHASAANFPVLRAQHQFVPIYSGQGGRPQTGGSLPRPANTAQGRIAQKFTGIFLCHHSSCGCFALPLQSSPELWIGASAAHGKFAKSTRQGGTLIICRGAREP